MEGNAYVVQHRRTVSCGISCVCHQVVRPEDGCVFAVFCGIHFEAILINSGSVCLPAPPSWLVGGWGGGYNPCVDRTILITNDDGIHAPGILALKKALSGLGDVVVIAPDRGRSACGHGITLHEPLRVHKVKMADGGYGYCCTGLPTDCVHLGLVHFCKECPPALVVSGINLGANLGWELTYSGTVAGAMEGAAFGVPSFGISVTTYEDGPGIFEAASQFARYLAERILERGLPDGTLLNVNVPPASVAGIPEVCLTRLGVRRYPGRVEVRKDPMGRKYYWLGGDAPTDGLEEGTDVLAVSQGKISVTPVHLDLTSFGAMEEIHTWPLGEFLKAPAGE